MDSNDCVLMFKEYTDLHKGYKSIIPINTRYVLIKLLKIFYE